MQDFTNPYASPYSIAAQSIDARAQFIRKTYAHLAGAIAAFTLIQYLLLQIPGINEQIGFLLGTSRFSWLIVIGIYMGISMLANKWALSNTSKTKQYFGLAIYIVALSLVFLPLMISATTMIDLGYKSLYGINIIGAAGLITGAMVLGITTIAFTTKKDFSFLGGILKMGFFIAIAAIVLSMVLGFSLGIVFVSAMVLLASGSVLYSTSNIIHQYNTNQYVAASLDLFASVGILFYYVLQLVMSFASSD